MTADQSGRRRMIRRATAVAGAAAACWLAARIGLLFVSTGSGLSLVWPPSGVAVAILVLYGMDLWPGVLLAALITNATTGAPPLAGVVMAVGTTLEAVVAVRLLRRFGAPRLTLDDNLQVRAFVLAAVPLAPLCAALIGALALILDGTLPAVRFASAVATWWTGDCLGLLVVAPVLTTWLHREAPRLMKRQLAELGVVLALTVLVSPLAVGYRVLGSTPLGRSFPYLLFPLVIWAGFRFGARGASLLTLLVAAIAVAYASQGSGPFVLATPGRTMLALLIYLLVLAVTGLVFSAATLRHRRAEAEARSGQRLLLDVVRNAPLVLFLTDREGRFTFSDGQGLAGAGLAPGQVVGQSAFDLYGDIVIGQADGGELRGADAIRRVLSGETVTGLSTLGATTFENRFLPMRGEHGEVRGMIGVSVDITERRRTEMQLRRAQKLEALGQLAGGIAHDFNNELTAVLSLSEFLLSELADHPTASADVGEIRRSALRAAGLTRQLLAFGRRQVLEAVPLDVNDAIRDVAKMLTRLIGEDIRLELVLAEGIGTVMADPGQLHQVIVNLAVNARDAMPRGGRLTIETANLDLPVDTELDGTGVPAGAWVSIAVRDTGVGMDASVQARIFEPFFTTKGAGHGTGLGLATVYGIAQQSGGHITVSSKVGEGATFRMLLPRCGRVEPAAEPAGRSSRAGRGELILLAEDDPALRRLIGRSLEVSGYRVAAAPDGAEALALFERLGEDVAMVVTDVVMPGMSGRDLVARLAALRPALRVLYLSGYTDGVQLREAAFDQHAGFLQKPFTIEALALKVREQLDRVTA